MDDITIEKLLDQVKIYNTEDVNFVRRAYECANTLHAGQIRQSGEPYITHPLNVAYILAEMHADSDTLCAGLLHDTLEDTNISKAELADLFNEDVANLVDGVTKISKMNFSSKQDQHLANTRKIITGLEEDIRIIIIKLADRLHNMRTLQFKSKFKQEENSLETMEIFAPLAYYIGAYRIKSELEDISFQYLNPDEYKKIAGMKIAIEASSQKYLEEVLWNIKNILDDKNIPNEIKTRTKNVYGIYRRLNAGHKLTDIHDLFSLKIMVDDIVNCYQTLGAIHSQYHPINNKFKDYLYNPKTNFYRSLHTTIFGPNGMLVQTQIRTFDMDKVASFGLPAYWEFEKNDARKVMQEMLREKCPFYKSLEEIDKAFIDNQEFVNKVKSELFADKVYIYQSDGNRIELPSGYTLYDFVHKNENDLKNELFFVNGKMVEGSYVFKNNDRINTIPYKTKTYQRPLPGKC